MSTPLTDKTTKTWVLLLTSAASFMAILDAMVVTTALGAIRQNLGASIELLQWTVNAYNLSFAVLLLTGAALGDRFGRRRVFITGITLFVAASVGCALAPGAGWLIAGRALQGVGAALLMPMTLTLLSAAFPPERRTFALHGRGIARSQGDDAARSETDAAARRGPRLDEQVVGAHAHDGLFDRG